MTSFTFSKRIDALDILMLVLAGSLSAVLIVGALTSAFGSPIISDVNAQSESELAQTIAQFIDGNPQCNVLLDANCLTLIYESPSRIILTADFINTIARGYNTAIWEIIEMQETKGFSVELIELTGQGTKGNPYSYFVVMKSTTSTTK